MTQPTKCIDINADVFIEDKAVYIIDTRKVPRNFSIIQACGKEWTYDQFAQLRSVTIHEDDIDSVTAIVERSNHVYQYEGVDYLTHEDLDKAVYMNNPVLAEYCNLSSMSWVDIDTNDSSPIASMVDAVNGRIIVKSNKFDEVVPVKIRASRVIKLELPKFLNSFYSIGKDSNLVEYYMKDHAIDVVTTRLRELGISVISDKSLQFKSAALPNRTVNIIDDIASTKDRFAALRIECPKVRTGVYNTIIADYEATVEKYTIEAERLAMSINPDFNAPLTEVMTLSVLEDVNAILLKFNEIPKRGEINQHKSAVSNKIMALRSKLEATMRDKFPK